MKNIILLLSLLLLVSPAVVSAQDKSACAAGVVGMIEASKKSKDFTTALQKANECVARSPKSAAALVARGRVLIAKKDFEPALIDLNKAVELDPKSSAAFLYRGLAHRDKTYAKENSTLALADFEKALELDPKNPAAFLYRSVLKRDRIGTGYMVLLPEFIKAIELAAGDPDLLAEAYYERGNLYGVAMMSKLSIDDFNTALKIKPDYGAPLHLRAMQYKLTGRPAEALADYNMIIKNDPSVWTLSQRAGVYEDLGDKEKALADYRAAAALEPGGYSEERVKELEAELAASKPKPAPSPQMTAVQYTEQGRRLAAQKDYDGAIKSFSECISVNPNAQPCYAFRGSIYGMKGDMASAQTDFDRAIKINPNVPGIYYIRAMMFVGTGKKEQAIADLRTVLKLSPNNPQALQVLQRLGVQP